MPSSELCRSTRNEATQHVSRIRASTIVALSEEVYNGDVTTAGSMKTPPTIRGRVRQANAGNLYNRTSVAKPAQTSWRGALEQRATTQSRTSSSAAHPTQLADSTVIYSDRAVPYLVSD